MGQVNSTPSDSFDSTKRVGYKDFVQNYLFIRKLKDPRYGDISLLQDKLTKQYVALREIAMNNSKDFERDSATLQARSKISHPNIIRILGYTSKSEEFIYSSEHKILVIMEYVENDLEKEIQRRRPKSEFYDEEHLWYILENTMKALLEFQRNAIVHRDVKTGSVLMSKMGVYKLIQPNVTSNTSPNTSRFLSDDNKPYLSPILLGNMQKASSKLDHNPWKSDVFSLGMVMLHAATLSPSDKLYNWRDNTINVSEVEQTLSTLKMIYSERLQNVLRLMLSIQEDKRPDFIELEKIISVSQVVAKNVQQQQQQPKQAPTLKFRVLDVPGQTSETQPREKDGSKQEKRSKIGMRTVLQENNANVTTKNKDSREVHLFSSEQKRVKSPAKIFEEKPLKYSDKPRSKAPNENAMLRIMTEPSQAPFLNKTYTKDRNHITQGSSSPLHLHTMNIHTEGDDYDHTVARELFPATKNSVTLENRSPVASLNSPQPKSSVTSQYKSLISNEVAQLMADFESRKERKRSPGNSNMTQNITQNISRVGEKENLEATGEVGSIRSPNGKLLQIIVNGGPGSIKHAGSPIQFDKSAYDSMQRSPRHTVLTDMKPTLPVGSSSTSNLQRERIFQNPYFPGAPVSPELQPRTIQITAPMASKTNFYMPGNYLTPQNKPRQVLNSSNSTLNLTGQQKHQEVSFDSNNNYSMNKIYNMPNTDANISNSEQIPGQLANSKSDPYLLFNRSNDQQVFEKPFADSYETIQPKDSVKSTSSTSSGLRGYLSGPNPEETITEKFADGSVYKGQKKSGLRHGKGTYHHSDGTMYSGDWFRGLMQGQGTLYYSGGSKAYQGQWREDKFDGKGVVFNEFPAKLSTDFDFRNFDHVGEYWVQYEGDFFNDQKQGTGTLFLTNGERYQGQFREDLVEGVGVFYTRSGKAFKGEWYKNRLVRPL